MRGHEEVRLGIAGCGAITTGIHLPNLLTIDGVRVTALADPDPAALGRAHRRVPPARTSTDWRELIEGDDVDAVLVALPTDLHAGAGIAALEAGRHLYLEKPIAVNEADAARLCDVAERAGRVAMIGFNYRFNPLFAQLRDIVACDTIGRLIAMRSCFSTHGQTHGWRAQTGNGGVLLDLGSHHVDLLRFIADRRIVDVSAISSGTTEGDTAAVTLRLDNGVVAQSLFSANGPEQDSIECIGEAGTATVRRYESVTVELRGRNAAGARRDQLRGIARNVRGLSYLRRKRRSPGSEPSYGIALRRFVQSIREGSPASPDMEDGRASLAVIAAARRAAETGGTVAIERIPAERDAAVSPSQ